MTTYTDWPWQYSFPPFFTVQPNLTTRQIQLNAWAELVLKYHKALRKYVLDVKEAQSSALFTNEEIKRTLPIEGINLVLSVLQTTGNAEPITSKRSTTPSLRWLILWHTIDEWASVVYDWAVASALTGSVCTFYEIINTPEQEFTNMDEILLKKALQRLEDDKKAEIMSMDDCLGVKFF